MCKFSVLGGENIQLGFVFVFFYLQSQSVYNSVLNRGGNCGLGHCLQTLWKLEECSYTNSQRTNLRGVKGWGSVTKLARLVSVKVTNKTRKCSEGLTVSVADSYSLYLINKYSALTADESVGCNQAQKALLKPLLTRTPCQSLAVFCKFRNGRINIPMKSYGVSKRGKIASFAAWWTGDV